MKRVIVTRSQRPNWETFWNNLPETTKDLVKTTFNKTVFLHTPVEDIYDLMTKCPAPSLFIHTGKGVFRHVKDLKTKQLEVDLDGLNSLRLLSGVMSRYVWKVQEMKVAAIDVFDNLYICDLPHFVSNQELFEKSLQLFSIIIEDYKKLVEEEPSIYSQIINEILTMPNKLYKLSPLAIKQGSEGENKMKGRSYCLIEVPYQRWMKSVFSKNVLRCIKELQDGYEYGISQYKQKSQNSTQTTEGEQQ